jgi:UDP-N-acetylglucosamine 2-epimerase
MIHVFIGTKAQYVKTAPVLKELERRGVDYNLIDSGQHGELAVSYRRYLGIREPDAYLSDSRKDVKTVFEAVTWSTRLLLRILFTPKSIFRDSFRSQTGICLIHGDTPTTLLSALVSKRLAIKVAHLESGLRSFNLLHPFPEEAIRILTMRLSDYLFAPNQWSYQNLVDMKLRGKLLLVEGNTNIDQLRNVDLDNVELPAIARANARFVVFSIHRAETILKKDRMGQIVALARKVALSYPVLFCLHPPTRRQLERFGYLDELASLENCTLSDLLPYPIFIGTLSRAYFIVTDGGSIQEESYYLNVPALVTREHTERTEGLGTTVCLSGFDARKMQDFLENVERYRSSDYQDTGLHPSQQIVDFILKLHNEPASGQSLNG